MRLSVTGIEAYRLWRDHEWMSLEDLEATLKHETVPNADMARGSAFHAILERPAGCRKNGYYEAHGLRFSLRGIDSALYFLPEGRVAEVKTTYELEGITLSGVADALHGLDVYEAKCTGRIDTEKYFDSFQWRAYLVMFNAQRVTYVLAQHKDGEVIDIQNVLPMTCYRYPALLDDVKRLANDCAEFVVQRGLESYCVAREPEAAA